MPRGQRAEHMTAALGSMVPRNSSAGYGPTGKAEQRYQPGPCPRICKHAGRPPYAQPEAYG
eukprot:4216623-Heterocapsa_arctica.AAC.1